jgi:lipoprotein-releasing system permease protein
MPRLELARLAVRFLAGAPGSRRGRGRLTGAVLAVAVSLVPLVVVQQVADGMILGIVERFIETGSYHLQAIHRDEDAPEGVEERLEALRRIPGVRSAVAERQGFGLVYSDHGRSGVTLRSVPQEYWSADERVREFMSVVEGEFDLDRDEAIVLGVDIASRLAVRPGEQVRVLTVRPLGEGRMLPRVSRFTVAGVVSTGYRDLDRLWSFIPLDRGRRVIPDETARDLIGIKVQSPFALDNPIFNRGVQALVSDGEQRRMATTVEDIARRLDSRWFLHSWYSAERGRYVSFLTSRNLLAFVMALIVMVAAVNISSALVLLVLEKAEDIAILRATGVSRGQIATVFLLCAAVIGVGGAVLGALLGVVLAININEVLRAVEIVSTVIAGRNVQLFSADFYLEHVPVEIALPPLFLAVFLALVLAVGAAVVPARRAAGISPERVLRRHG